MGGGRGHCGSRFEHLFGLLRGVDPVHRLALRQWTLAVRDRVYPVTAPDIAADQPETRPARGIHRDHRVHQHAVCVPPAFAGAGSYPPGRGPGGAVPWSGTSPHYGPVLPGRAARHRPRRSNRTNPRPALPPSLSGWRRTAQPAAHLCGRRPAGAGTPFYAKTSVRGFAPPFIKAHISEGPERQFHRGSCWSVAAGQRIVLASRRTSEKFGKVPNATLHLCMP